METLHQANEIIAQRYRIVAPLGRGQNSSTYEAEDLTNNQRVALKILSLRQVTDWKVLELFEREAKILSNLNHPAIPKYINYFHSDSSHDRRFYLVQELVSGESLFKLVQKGWHPTEKEVQGIALQVLEILNYLHSMKPPVIHRDIKPQNLMRTSKGKIYLVDFGAVQDVYRNTLTRGGTFVGTLGYMPLEQFSGSVVPGSDLYSLGATLLFLLTGHSPEDLPQRRMKIDFRSRVQIKAKFADWLEKMLAPAIEDRFQSATEAKDALGVRASTDKSAEKETADLKYRLSANSNIFINADAVTVDLKHWQPDKSDIFINKTDQQLVVKLYDLNYNKFLLKLLFLIGFWICIDTIWSDVDERFVENLKIISLQMYIAMHWMFSKSIKSLIDSGITAIISICLFSLDAYLGASNLFSLDAYLGASNILFVTIVLKILVTKINKIWRFNELEIDKEKFILSKKIGGIVYYNYQGKTTDIEKIETHQKLYKIFGIWFMGITKCVIWEGVRKYSLKSSNREKCEWLAAEISHFVAQMRSPEAAER